MALEKYTGCAIDIHNQRQLESSTVEVDRTSGAVDQHTMAKGFAGQSPGSPMMTIKVTNAVRSVGFDYDPGPDMLALAIVPLTIYVDGAFMRCTGIVQSDNFKKAVDANASLEITFKCEFAQWQQQALVL
jgi:hypothetical protein